MTSPLRQRVTFRLVSHRLVSPRIRARTLLQLRTARPLAAGLRFVSYRCVSNRFKSVRFDSLQVVTRTLSPLRMAGPKPQGYVSCRVVSNRFVSTRFESDRIDSDRLHSTLLNSGHVDTRTRPQLRTASPLGGGLRFVSFQIVSHRVASSRIVSNRLNANRLGSTYCSDQTHFSTRKRPFVPPWLGRYRPTPASLPHSFRTRSKMSCGI